MQRFPNQMDDLMMTVSKLYGGIGSEYRLEESDKDYKLAGKDCFQLALDKEGGNWQLIDTVLATR